MLLVGAMRLRGLGFAAAILIGAASACGESAKAPGDGSATGGTTITSGTGGSVTGGVTTGGAGAGTPAGASGSSTGGDGAGGASTGGGAGTAGGGASAGSGGAAGDGAGGSGSGAESGSGGLAGSGLGGAGAGNAGGAGGSTAGTGGSSGRGGGGGSGGMLTPNVTVTVNPARRFQTLEGWGTSLCWFANVIGGWTEAKRSAVADLLFHPTNGLGFNIVRYNIGGGEAPGHEHMGAGKEMPGFKATEAAAYDWNADANQRWFLQAAKTRIDPARFIAEAFSNSPPYWMTNSGCASGASGGGNNLKTDYYDNFADYLSEVVLHFRDSFGVTFRTLEPLNEPVATWWASMGAQEGCHFDRNLQAQLLREVRTRLDAKGLTAVRLSAPDESSLDETVDTWASYDTATKAVVAQINTHAYSGTRRAELRAAATRDMKKVWSSEIDGSGAPQPFDVYPHNHNDIVPGLDLANRITRDLKDMQVDGWVFWQAVESEQAQTSLNKNWGLLHGDFQNGTETWSVTKKFHVMMQYTRGIKPGSTMLEATHADAVAFVNATDRTLTIVQRNAGTTSSVYGYDLSTFPAVGAVATAVRTSASENHQMLPDIAVVNKRLVAPIPAQSVTTFVVSDVTVPLSLSRRP